MPPVHDLISKFDQFGADTPQFKTSPRRKLSKKAIFEPRHDLSPSISRSSIANKPSRVSQILQSDGVDKLDLYLQQQGERLRNRDSMYTGSIISFYKEEEYVRGNDQEETGMGDSIKDENIGLDGRTYQRDVQEAEVQEAETQEAETQEAEIQEAEVQEPEVQKSDDNKGNIQGNVPKVDGQAGEKIVYTEEVEESEQGITRKGSTHQQLDNEPPITDDDSEDQKESLSKEFEASSPRDAIDSVGVATAVGISPVPPSKVVNEGREDSTGTKVGIPPSGITEGPNRKETEPLTLLVPSKGEIKQFQPELYTLPIETQFTGYKTGPLVPPKLPFQDHKPSPSIDSDKVSQMDSFVTAQVASSTTSSLSSRNKALPAIPKDATESGEEDVPLTPEVSPLPQPTITPTLVVPPSPDLLESNRKPKSLPCLSSHIFDAQDLNSLETPDTPYQEHFSSIPPTPSKNQSALNPEDYRIGQNKSKKMETRVSEHSLGSIPWSPSKPAQIPRTGKDAEEDVKHKWYHPLLEFKLEKPELKIKSSIFRKKSTGKLLSADMIRYPHLERLQYGLSGNPQYLPVPRLPVTPILPAIPQRPEYLPNIPCLGNGFRASGNNINTNSVMIDSVVEEANSDTSASKEQQKTANEEKNTTKVEIAVQTEKSRMSQLVEDRELQHNFEELRNTITEVYSKSYNKSHKSFDFSLYVDEVFKLNEGC